MSRRAEIYDIRMKIWMRACCVFSHKWCVINSQICWACMVMPTPSCLVTLLTIESARMLLDVFFLVWEVFIRRAAHMEGRLNSKVPYAHSLSEQNQPVSNAGS